MRRSSTVDGDFRIYNHQSIPRDDMQQILLLLAGSMTHACKQDTANTCSTKSQLARLDSIFWRDVIAGPFSDCVSRDR